MNEASYRYVYGPVHSRRLGQSLGIDLIPYKTCSYDCVYCQLGRTTNKTLKRKEYIAVDDVLMELERKLAFGKSPDYISIAGSGEPTLNSRIGDLILRIRKITDVPVAVFTNSSLLWMDDVQEALMPAHLILPSLDTADAGIFRHVNRPHVGISFERMVEGLASFTNRFKGDIWLEILLLKGITGISQEAKKIAAIIGRFRVTRVQLNTVVRPPAEALASAVPEAQMLALRNLFPGRVDIIACSEPEKSSEPPFANSRSNDILSLLGRRPCTCIDIAKGLGLQQLEAIKDLDALVASGKIRATLMGNKAFYVVV
jgi:wyosine [tRNA(Phe)-imidazoG37] synthetase (radical SAM superfamily)